MFGLAYVILPFSEVPPAEAIAASLARFQRGRRGDVPDDWLRFHDDTADLRAMYEATYTFKRKGGLSIAGGESWYLNSAPVIETMEQRGQTKWIVRFAEIEPNFPAFVERYVSIACERHPVTGGYGRWLNGLGQWDWWELGGRFNGAITGQKLRQGHARTAITSGSSQGREAFELLSGAIADACGDERVDEINVATDDNIELVATLAEALKQGLPNAIPGAIVLPSGAVEDSERWLDRWPELYAKTLPETEAYHGPPWQEIVKDIYERFADHWVAGVSYHF
jgi:hypothetical protein